jgi:hypothetical protein
MDTTNHLSGRETNKTLAAKYHVNIRTFRKWLKPIEYLFADKIAIGRRDYTPREVKMIYEHLGEPEMDKNNNVSPSSQSSINFEICFVFYLSC